MSLTLDSDHAERIDAQNKLERGYHFEQGRAPKPTLFIGYWPRGIGLQGGKIAELIKAILTGNPIEKSALRIGVSRSTAYKVGTTLVRYLNDHPELADLVGRPEPLPFYRKPCKYQERHVAL